MNNMTEPLENIFIPNTPPINTVTEPPEKMTSCIICTEKYSKSIHKPIECQYCKFEACRECCQKYVLNETVPKCMSPECNREWTRQFLSSKFTKAWISRDFKKHREDVLFNGERSLMPATQVLVENILRKEHLQEEITQVRLQISILYNRINDLQREYYRVGRPNGANGATEEARAKFIRACPDPECRGFLSSQWKCGICEKWTCPTCHEVKGTERDVEHVCDPNNVATAQLLATDTKPCPKCGEGIFKIDGCFAANVPILLWSGLHKERWSPTNFLSTTNSDGDNVTERVIDVTTKMSQDIAVGDVLVGDDGKPRNVIRLMEGEDEMYEVQQSNGMSYTVNSKHTLLLKYTIHKHGKKSEDSLLTQKDEFCAVGDPCEITVEDYLQLSSGVRERVKGYKYNSDILSDIIVKPLGKGKYYGWEVDNYNHRFILKDFTCVKNCNQMWCTSCHTAFDWRTGKIEQVVHNPHYYEFMRQQGNGEMPRNPLDLPCGQREINHRTATELVRLFNTHKTSNDSELRMASLLRSLGRDEDIHTLLSAERPTTKTIAQKAEIDEYIRRTGNICQSIVHLRRVEMPRYTFNRLENNQELRIKYMRNQLAEDKFKILIQQSDKKHQKNREIHQVMQMIHDTATDIILRFMDVIKQPEWSLDYTILNEISPLVEYANTCFREISITYNSKFLSFNNDLRLVY